MSAPRLDREAIAMRVARELPDGAVTGSSTNSDRSCPRAAGHGFTRPSPVEYAPWRR